MRDEIDSPHPQNGEGESSGEQSNQSPSAGRGRTNADTENGPEEELHLKGDMQGIAGKLKDPAWAGVLAANDGNTSLTDAERAVPKPNERSVCRLRQGFGVGDGYPD